MTDEFEYTDKYNDRLNKAYELDMADLVIDPEAMNSWVESLIQNGLEPREILNNARAKYDPDTKDLYLTVPVKDEEETHPRHMVFVLQDDYWSVDTSGHILQ